MLVTHCSGEEPGMHWAPFSTAHDLVRSGQPTAGLPEWRFDLHCLLCDRRGDARGGASFTRHGERYGARFLWTASQGWHSKMICVRAICLADEFEDLFDSWGWMDMARCLR